MIVVKLTNKELEIMNVLWDSEIPMSANDIIAVSPNRTWKDASIHVMLKSLVTKKAVGLDHHIPTTGRAAGAFRVLLSREEYVLLIANELGVEWSSLMAAEALSRHKKSPKKG